MSENKVSEIIKSSLEGIKNFTDMESVIGEAINTPSGVTVIPVSKITVGFAGGGVDFGAKRTPESKSFGSGSGSGISITPIAFLTVDPNANINIIHINNAADAGIEKITALIEHAPEIIQKAKNALKE